MFTVNSQLLKLQFFGFAVEVSVVWLEISSYKIHLNVLLEKKQYKSIP